MKKLISLVTVVAIIAASSLCAFASTDITSLVADAQVITANETTGLYDVVAPSTGAYSTILAVKGKTIQVGAIQYINQANAEGGSATFSFALNDDLLNNETSAPITDDVYVLTGGDGEMNVAGYIDVTPEAPQPTAFTVSGTVANAPSQDFIDELTGYVVELYGEEQVEHYVSAYEITAHLISEDEFENFVLTTINEADGFEALQTTKVSFADGSYSFSDVEAGTYAVALTCDGAITWVDYVTVEAGDVAVEDVDLVYGDVITAKDAMIDSVDITHVVNNQCDIETETFNGAYDVKTDCMVDVVDITNVVLNLGDIYVYDTEFINQNF